MEFTYGKAPVYCINGVPAYKAGEWPGIKSNRFENTRRIIQPKNCGIIFNENEPLPPPRRKILHPGPSPEYVFRPCCKMVDTSQFCLPPKMSSLKVREQVFTQNKLDYEKRHNFPYLIDKENKKNEQEKNMNISNYIKNELKLATLIGFKSKKFDNVSNKDLLKLKYSRTGGKLQLNFNEDIFDKNQVKRQNMNDYNYVKNLNEWDAKYKELDRKYKAQENIEIQETVHSYNLTPGQLADRLKKMESGDGNLNIEVPGSKGNQEYGEGDYEAQE